DAVMGIFPELTDSFASTVISIPFIVDPLGMPNAKSDNCPSSESSQALSQEALESSDVPRRVVVKSAHPVLTSTVPAVLKPVSVQAEVAPICLSAVATNASPLKTYSVVVEYFAPEPVDEAMEYHLNG